MRHTNVSPTQTEIAHLWPGQQPQFATQAVPVGAFNGQLAGGNWDFDFQPLMAIVGFGAQWGLDFTYKIAWTTEQGATNQSPPASNAAMPLPLAYYRIVTFADKVLDVEGNACANGASVIQFSWHGEDNQRWRFDRQPDGTYIIVNKASQKVLDVTGGPNALTAGTKVQQWSNLKGSNQRWRIEDLGQGQVRLIPVHSGQSLDVEGISPLDLARLQQWPWLGGPNQKFKLELLQEDVVVPFARPTCY